MESIRELLVNNPRTFIIIIILFAITTRYILQRPRRKYRLPPGPFSLPIVGTLPFLGVDVREPLRKLSEKYGDMFTVYFGSNPVIVLNSYESIKEALVKNGNIFTGRPQHLFYVKDIQKGLGVVTSEGPAWKENRKLSHNILRSFGVGSVYMEERIQKESSCLVEALANNCKNAIDPVDYIMPGVANVIFSVCFGNRREYDDPKFIYYLKIMKKSFELLSNSGILTVFPSLRHLPGDMTGYKELMGMVSYMKKEYIRFVQEHEETYQEGTIRDFVDAYLKALYEEQKAGNSTELSKPQLETVVGDLFGAGTETTTTTLCWGLVYMLHHPDILEKIHEEIDSVVGRNTPRMSDKQNMPYTEACLQEIQRLGDIVPLGIPHSPMEDITLYGYDIPKDTMVLPNIYAVHYNEQLWPNPRQFDPRRFLDEDGKSYRQEKLIPFSMGKRVCLGESLARMELFLMFVSLLQNFSIALPEGDALPNLVGNFGVTNIPKPFKVKFNPRF